MKKMIVLAFVTLIGLFGCLSYAGSVKDISDITIEPIDLATVRDGSYEAYVDYRLDTARVRVSVKSGAITELLLLEHRHGPGEEHDGSRIIDRVKLAQSLDVDAVAGATGSGKVILKAIETALRQGRD